MAQMEIRTFGDWEFIFDCYNAVARLTDSGLLNNIAMIAFALAFAWGIISQMVDDKPNVYFKEMMLGIIMWVLLGSPDGVRVDVKITSVQDESIFAVVDDVPFLAAFPGWLATNALAEIREELEAQFLPISYTSGSGANDPLQSIVRIYNTPMPDRMLYGPTPSNGGYDLARSVRNYIKDCYIMDHELDGREPISPVSQLRKQMIGSDLFSYLKVDYNGIGATMFLEEGGSEFGTFETCPTAYTSISNALGSTSLETYIKNAYQNKGITDAAVRDGIATIRGSYATGPTAYDIQIGLFTSYLIRDGLQNTAFETEVDQMVFQAQRSRLLSNAGEATLFQQVSTPVVTALECFSLFIYPIYVIMLVIGSVGVKQVGKYFMLIIFVNLWGILKVFVDFYTIKSTERAFSTITDPFSYDGMANTIVEIEGFLSVAAALNTAIPMFVMFLLFGGVHSLMGAMKGITQGSVDSKYAAPNISSSMNNGTRQWVDLNETMSATTGNSVVTNKGHSDAYLGNNTLQNAVGQSTQNVGTESASLAKQSVGSFNRQLATAYEGAHARDSGIRQTDTESAGLDNAIDFTKDLSSSVANQHGVSAETLNALVVAGSGGVGVNGGAFKVGAELKESLSNTFGEKHGEIIATMESEGTRLAESEKYSNMFGESESSGETFSGIFKDSGQELYQAAQSTSAQLQDAASFQEAVDESVRFTKDVQLPVAEAAALYNLSADELYSRLTSEIALQDINQSLGIVDEKGELMEERTEADLLSSKDITEVLERNNINSSADILALSNDPNIAGNYTGSVAGGISGMMTKLLTNEANENTSHKAVENGIAGYALRYVADEFNNAGGATGDNQNVSGARIYQAAADEINKLGAMQSRLALHKEDLEKGVDTSIELKDIDTIQSDNLALQNNNEAILDSKSIMDDVRSQIDARNGKLGDNTFENSDRYKDVKAQQGQLDGQYEDRKRDTEDMATIGSLVRDGVEFANAYAPNNDEQQFDYSNPIALSTAGHVKQSGSDSLGVIDGAANLVGSQSDNIKNASPGQLANMLAASKYIESNDLLDSFEGTEFEAQYLSNKTILENAIGASEERDLIERLGQDVSEGKLSGNIADALLTMSSGEDFNVVTDFTRGQNTEDIENGFSMSFSGAAGYVAKSVSDYEGTNAFTVQELFGARSLADNYGLGDKAGNFDFLSSLSGTPFKNDQLEYSEMNGAAGIAAVSTYETAMLHPEKLGNQSNSIAEDWDIVKSANTLSDAVYTAGAGEWGELFKNEQSSTGVFDKLGTQFSNLIQGSGLGSSYEEQKTAMGYGSGIVKEQAADFAQQEQNNGMSEKLESSLLEAQKTGFSNTSFARVADSSNNGLVYRDDADISSTSAIGAITYSGTYSDDGNQEGNKIYGDEAGNAYIQRGDSEYAVASTRSLEQHQSEPGFIPSNQETAEDIDNSINSSTPDTTAGVNTTSVAKSQAPDTPTGVNTTSDAKSQAIDTPTGVNTTSDAKPQAPDTTAGVNTTSVAKPQVTDTTAGVNTTSDAKPQAPDTTAGVNTTSVAKPQAPDTSAGVNTTSDAKPQAPDTSAGVNTTSDAKSQAPDTSAGVNTTSVAKSQAPDTPTGVNTTSDAKPDLAEGTANTTGQSEFITGEFFKDGKPPVDGTPEYSDMRLTQEAIQGGFEGINITEPNTSTNTLEVDGETYKRFGTLSEDGEVTGTVYRDTSLGGYKMWNGNRFKSVDDSELSKVNGFKKS